VIVSLSTGDVEVVPAPPLQRAAVLAAHPLPDVPMLKIRRADGGYDDWPDEQNPDYRRRLGEAHREQETALWEFYCVTCLPAVEPPADWRESEQWQTLEWVKIRPRDGTRGLKLDYVEYGLIDCLADERRLREAFVVVHDVTAEDRAQAEAFFGLLWDGVPVTEAAERLDRGKLTFRPGFAQFEAAAQWGFWPFARSELPPELQSQARNAIYYYDLPPALRARMEVFFESRMLIEALRAHEAYRGAKGK
jgi:hypothetical protein